jgi:hypothetical protein
LLRIKKLAIAIYDLTAQMNETPISINYKHSTAMKIDQFIDTIRPILKIVSSRNFAVKLSAIECLKPDFRNKVSKWKNISAFYHFTM